MEWHVGSIASHCKKQLSEILHAKAETENCSNDYETQPPLHHQAQQPLRCESASVAEVGAWEAFEDHVV